MRITALVPELLAALASAFDPSTPLGKEPLFLENVRFEIVPQESRLESLSTYAALLTSARPRSWIDLAFRSPTTFRSRQQTGIVPPACVLKATCANGTPSPTYCRPRSPYWSTQNSL